MPSATLNNRQLLVLVLLPDIGKSWHRYLRLFQQPLYYGHLPFMLPLNHSLSTHCPKSSNPVSSISAKNHIAKYAILTSLVPQPTIINFRFPSLSPANTSSQILQPSRNRSFINNDHHYQGCRNRAGMGGIYPPIFQNFDNFKLKNTV